MNFKNFWNTLNMIQKRFFFIIIILVLLAATIELIGIASIVPLINLVIQDDFASKFPKISFFLLDFSKLIIPDLFFESNSTKTNFVIGGLTIFAIFYFFKTIFLIFLHYVFVNFTNNIALSISTNMYKGYLGLDYLFHTSKNSAHLKQNILTETNTFASVFNSLLILISEIIILISISCFLFFYNWELSLAAITFLVFFSSILLIITKKPLSSWGIKRVQSMSSRFKTIQEGLESIKEIYIYQRFLYFLNFYEKSSKTFFKAQTNYLVTLNSTRPIFEFIGLLGLITILFILIFQNNSSDYLISTLGLFLAASLRLLPSLNKIIQSFQNIKFNNACIDRILGEFETIKQSKKLITANTNINFKNSISFHDVGFAYPNKDKSVFSKVNFIIKKGSKIGIQGFSGSGKTTLVNLILTLIRPTEGQIKVDDKTLEQNNLSWTKNIGYVAQNTTIIDDTIENNILFGIGEEKANKDKIKKAIESAQLTSFINNLKDGILAKVGEKGQRISGGQQQRIGIARALYDNPNILVLDEPTSALDLETEKSFINTIFSLEKNKTIIIISHRKSVLSKCDKILSVEKGRISEI